MNPDDLCRRSWILRLGGASVLRGIGSNSLRAEPPTQLPPGLYEPSVQHLAHTLKDIGPAPASSAPHYFGPEDFSLLCSLVAIILGEDLSSPVVREIAAWIDLIAGRSEGTRTAARALSPAHRRLAVDYYGEDTVRELESENAQDLCRGGLADLKHSGFETLDASAQLALLLKREDAHDPFIAWLKRRTLEGFYTSRQGLQELDYKGNAFYAQSPGCDPEDVAK